MEGAAVAVLEVLAADLLVVAEPAEVGEIRERTGVKIDGPHTG